MCNSGRPRKKAKTQIQLKAMIALCSKLRLLFWDSAQDFRRFRNKQCVAHNCCVRNILDLQLEFFALLACANGEMMKAFLLPASSEQTSSTHSRCLYLAFSIDTRPPPPPTNILVMLRDASDDSANIQHSV